MVVFIAGRGSERRIETIAEVTGIDEHGDYVFKPLSLPQLQSL